MCRHTSYYLLLFFNYNHWNGITEENDRNLIDKIINRFYFLTSTISTSGYGDITPKTKKLKVIIIFKVNT